MVGVGICSKKERKMERTVESQQEVDYLTIEIQLMESNLQIAQKIGECSQLLLMKRLRLNQFKARLRELTE